MLGLMAKKSDYEKERDKWYAKLKKAGFEDAERNENDLKQGSSRLFIRHKYAAVLWESKQEYYRLAEFFLNEHKFESELERAVWEYHTNGISASDISETLRKAKVTKLKTTSIKTILKRLSEAMKRKYLVHATDTRGH